MRETLRSGTKADIAQSASSGKNEDVTGRQRWTERAARKGRTIQIPERRPSRARLEQHIVWFTVAVEIGRALQHPAGRLSGTIGTGDMGRAIQVPNSRLARTGITEHKIGLAVAVEISASTSIQPAGSVGPYAVPVSAVPLRNQIAVWRVLALKST